MKDTSSLMVSLHVRPTVDMDMAGPRYLSLLQPAQHRVCNMCYWGPSGYLFSLVFLAACPSFHPIAPDILASIALHPLVVRVSFCGGDSAGLGFAGAPGVMFCALFQGCTGLEVAHATAPLFFVSLTGGGGDNFTGGRFRHP